MKLKLLAEHKVENDIYEHKNSKTNEPHTFDLNLSQIFDLRSSSKHIVLDNSTKTISSKSKLQHIMMSLNYLMVLMHCQLFKTIS